MLFADEVARGTNGMGVDRTGKGQAAGVCGAVLTELSLARLGAMGGMRQPGIEVSSDKKLMEVGKMVEGD